jgi:DNA-binding PadR family transcriptional regulator
MIYTLSVDVQALHEWNLTPLESFVFCWLFRAPTWATPVDMAGRTMYHVSRNECCRQLSMPGTPEDEYYCKPDTVYRIYKSLEQKGVIVYHKFGKQDLFCLTERGKQWNTRRAPKNSDENPNPDKNPSELGSPSEKGGKNSDENPTNNSISNNSIIDTPPPPTEEEEKIQEAINKLTRYFKFYPTFPKTLLEEAGVKATKEMFYSELVEWMWRNSDKADFVINPISHIRKGPSNFKSWLKGSHSLKAYTEQNAGKVYDKSFANQQS